MQLFLHRDDAWTEAAGGCRRLVLYGWPCWVVVAYLDEKARFGMRNRKYPFHVCIHSDVSDGITCGESLRLSVPKAKLQYTCLLPCNKARTVTPFRKNGQESEALLRQYDLGGPSSYLPRPVDERMGVIRALPNSVDFILCRLRSCGPFGTHMYSTALITATYFLANLVR